MANSKNTIQNIPLEAELCMNQLRTEVKPFQGYNEKNTTVYGGTLSPIYDKKTDLFDKDNSYTVFNSKGVPYTLVKEDGEIHLYKGNEAVEEAVGIYLTKTTNLNLSRITTIEAMSIPGYVVYVTDNGEVYCNDTLIETSGITDVFDAQIFYDSARQFFYVVLVSFTDCQLITYDIAQESVGVKSSIMGLVTPFSSETTPMITNTPLANDTWCFYVYKSGDTYARYDSNPNATGPVTKIVLTQGNDVSVEPSWNMFLQDFQEQGDSVSYRGYRYSSDSIEIQQFVARSLYTNMESVVVPYLTNYGIDKTTSGYVGEGGSYPLGGYYDNFSIYYQKGSLISIGNYGVPIDSCLSYGKDAICFYKTTDNEFYLTYKKSNGDWMYYSAVLASSITESIVPYLERSVFDNRYVFFKSALGLKVFDIEEERFVNNANHMDWIVADPPYSVENPYNVNPSLNIKTTGCIFAAGFNAGYQQNNNQFVGYLPNPFVLKNSPPMGMLSLPEVPDGVQYYCSAGDTVMSATYFGSDSTYANTNYPIDSNSNIVLPVSLNSEVIKGYSNNDMVREGDVTFPLMYWNNNQKTYTYYLLASMENVIGAFSLQGQQYTVDAENIYAVTYNAGIIQNANAVCYKKNMTFLGTLPTQAVFWSEFNKTFYAFTGDRVLSKMFEASDINKIYYVGQNPSSLSLWICSDTGIYILSDSDMYKLDYVSKQVSFQPKTALIVTEGETINEVHAISLYLNKDEKADMIPVKLKTAYYGLGNEQKAVMDCWYLRLFDAKRTEGYVKVKVNTITDVTRHTEEKVYHVNPSDYDDNNIFYIRYQPKYQECVSMQLELETNLGIYSMALGVNTTDSATQVSKFNF